MLRLYQSVCFLQVVYINNFHIFPQNGLFCAPYKQWVFQSGFLSSIWLTLVWFFHNLRVFFDFLTLFTLQGFSEGEFIPPSIHWLIPVY
jgi:hypothetical protein